MTQCGSYSHLKGLRSNPQRFKVYLDNVQARLTSLLQLQEETEEELSALPSILDKAFKGEL
jgi:hypothetical protein